MQSTYGNALSRQPSPRDYVSCSPSQHFGVTGPRRRESRTASEPEAPILKRNKGDVAQVAVKLAVTADKNTKCPAK
jgi:hypothetical protein